jgi:hypothetical protein
VGAIAMKEARTVMRVLLGRMSNMVANIITNVLADAPDVTVAGRVGPVGDLVADIRFAEADAVILHDDAGNREQIMTALRSLPALKVVTISTDGRSGCLYELRLCTVHLEELSGGLLRRALQGEIIAHPC